MNRTPRLSCPLFDGMTIMTTSPPGVRHGGELEKMPDK